MADRTDEDLLKLSRAKLSELLTAEIKANTEEKTAVDDAAIDYDLVTSDGVSEFRSFLRSNSLYCERGVFLAQKLRDTAAAIEQCMEVFLTRDNVNIILQVLKSIEHDAKERREAGIGSDKGRTYIGRYENEITTWKKWAKQFERVEEVAESLQAMKVDTTDVATSTEPHATSSTMKPEFNVTAHADGLAAGNPSIPSAQQPSTVHPVEQGAATKGGVSAAQLISTGKCSLITPPAALDITPERWQYIVGQARQARPHANEQELISMVLNKIASRMTPRAPTAVGSAPQPMQQHTSVTAPTHPSPPTQARTNDNSAMPPSDGLNAKPTSTSTATQGAGASGALSAPGAAVAPGAPTSVAQSAPGTATSQSAVANAPTTGQNNQTQVEKMVAEYGIEALREFMLAKASQGKQG